MLREEEEGDPRASRRASSAHAPRSRPALREMIRSSVVLSSPALQLMHALTVDLHCSPPSWSFSRGRFLPLSTVVVLVLTKGVLGRPVLLLSLECCLLCAFCVPQILARLCSLLGHQGRQGRGLWCLGRKL